MADSQWLAVLCQSCSVVVLGWWSAQGVVVVMAVMAIVVPAGITVFWFCQVCRADGAELALSLVRTMLPSGRGACCVDCGGLGRWIVESACGGCCCCRSVKQALQEKQAEFAQRNAGASRWRACTRRRARLDLAWVAAC